MGNEKEFSSLALDHINIYISLPKEVITLIAFMLSRTRKKRKKFNTMTFKLEVLGKGYKLSLLITFK